MHFMANGDVYKVHIDSIASGGDALGRIDGKPVFITGGAPDETVHCRIVEDRNTWARAEILEIIEPSPVRCEPVCAFYGKCGGCNLQHIDYNAQLRIKAAILKDSFLRIGGINPLEIEVFSSPPYEYRNRMQFHCLRDKQNSPRNAHLRCTADYRGKNTSEHKYGLKGRASEVIIPVNDCPIAVPEIREILQSVNSISIPPEKDRFTVFAKDEVLLNEGGQQRGKIKLLEKEITIDAGLFFQSNCFMLEKLILELQKIAEGVNRDLLMADLYCGVGTFALFLGDMFPKVILAEENKAAVSLARENLRGVTTEFFALRDTNWPDQLFRKKDNQSVFGFMVVDPPRAGLAPKLAITLAQNGPALLIYVSCDPASLARDSKILVKGGYTLKELKLFDFYPQTAHIESLAVYTRNAYC